MNKNGNVQIGRSRILYLKNNNPTFYMERRGTRFPRTVRPRRGLRGSPLAMLFPQESRKMAMLNLNVGI
jgi:hypothetical protein